MNDDRRTRGAGPTHPNADLNAVHANDHSSTAHVEGEPGARADADAAFLDDLTDREPDDQSADDAQATDPLTGPVVADAAQDADGDGDTAYEYDDDTLIQIRRPLFWTAVVAGIAAILALGAATAWLAYDRTRSADPVVATVNGEKIHRTEYDRAVASGSGAEVLDNLVTERLVANEAKKRNIVVDDSQAAKLLADQKAKFGTDQAFQSALAQAGLTENDLTKQLRLSEALRQMIADRVSVTDQEVEQQYTAAQDRYAGQSPEQAKEQVRQGLQQQKEGVAVRDLLDQLRAEAKIETFLPGKPL